MATPGDARYQPPYQYHCTNGHHIAADTPQHACPAAGCTGNLTRVGTGSRTPQEAS